MKKSLVWCFVVAMAVLSGDCDRMTDPSPEQEPTALKLGLSNPPKGCRLWH